MGQALPVWSPSRGRGWPGQTPTGRGQRGDAGIAAGVGQGSRVSLFQRGRLRRWAGQPLALAWGGSRTPPASGVEFGGHCLDAVPECAVA